MVGLGWVGVVFVLQAEACDTNTTPTTQCRKPYAEAQHLKLLMMGICSRDM